MRPPASTAADAVRPVGIGARARHPSVAGSVLPGGVQRFVHPAFSLSAEDVDFAGRRSGRHVVPRKRHGLLGRPLVRREVVLEHVAWPFGSPAAIAADQIEPLVGDDRRDLLFGFRQGGKLVRNPSARCLTEHSPAVDDQDDDEGGNSSCHEHVQRNWRESYHA